MYKARLNPGDVPVVLAKLGDRRDVVIASPFLGARTRERLTQLGLNYIDLTGNTAISITRPAVVIRTRGADRPPPSFAGPPTPRRSLKGPSAARIVRALVELRSPSGVRAIAERAGSTPGYVSKLLDVLTTDDFVSRTQSGGVAAVSWQDLLRRWAQDYDVLRTNRAVSYVDDIERARDVLRLREAGKGANVILLEPYDASAYERTVESGGLRLASLAQIAVDLLTSPGRGPVEVDALLRWMEERADAWSG